MALSELENVRSPSWTFGAGIHFEYEGKRWVCEFNKLTGTAGIGGALIRSGNPLGEVLGISIPERLEDWAESGRPS